VSSVGVKLLTPVDSLTRYGTAKQEAPGFSRGVAHETINQLKNTNEKITVKNIADLAGVCKNSASKYLKQAREEGIL